MWGLAAPSSYVHGRCFEWADKDGVEEEEEEGEEEKEEERPVQSVWMVSCWWQVASGERKDLDHLTTAVTLNSCAWTLTFRNCHSVKMAFPFQLAAWAC